MKFYFNNSCGDRGYFNIDDLPKAIMSAWNIEAELYIVNGEEKKLIFAPFEDNDFNNDMLEEYGLLIKNGETCRELYYKSGKLAWQPGDWDNVLDLF